MKIRLSGVTPVEIETTTHGVLQSLHRTVRSYCGVPPDAGVHEGHWAELHHPPFLHQKIRPITLEEEHVLAALARLQEFLP